MGCCCRHPRPLNRHWRGCRERKDKLATETHERNKTKCLKGTDVNLGKGRRGEGTDRKRQEDVKEDEKKEREREYENLGD